MKDWKACERKVAALLGGRRIPVSGRGRGYSPDIQHERLSIEVKSRRKLPAWINDALCQAEASAKDGQLCVAILHQDGQRYQDALMVMRLKDFADYYHAKGEAQSMKRTSTGLPESSTRPARGRGVVVD